MIRLHEITLAAAWIFFFVSGFSMASCVVLVLAGAYAIAMVLPSLLGRRHKKRPCRKSCK